MPELEIITKIVSWPASILGVAYFMRPVWAALAEKLRGWDSKVNGKIKELEDFKYTTENNHFHDLEDVMKDVKQLQRDFNQFQIQMENRISRLEAKVLNGYSKQ